MLVVHDINSYFNRKTYCIALQLAKNLGYNGSVHLKDSCLFWYSCQNTKENERVWVSVSLPTASYVAINSPISGTLLIRVSVNPRVL